VSSLFQSLIRPNPRIDPGIPKGKIVAIFKDKLNFDLFNREDKIRLKITMSEAEIKASRKLVIIGLADALRAAIITFKLLD